MKNKITAVELKNISFQYKENTPLILKDFNLEIKKGEWVTLLGHNGSGKSTISKIMAGLITPTKGRVKILGKQYSEGMMCDIRKNISIVFQNPDSQFIGATVEDDIAFGLENHNFKPEDMKDIILKQLKSVDMINFLQAQPHNLSGGQKQRVAIAGILALSPEIVIFDESTSMLDPKGVKDINKIMHEIHREHGVTVICITHNMEEAIDSDRIIIIEKGQIKADTQPKNILFDEAKMSKLKLQSPFAVQLSHKLMKAGIITSESLTVEEVLKCL